MAYIDEGNGPQTLLFIHGLANYALVWKKNIEQLSSRYRCIAIDLPGNGFSDRNEHRFSMAFFAETVHHFIATLKLTNLCIVGHSMGGQIALTTLLSHPDAAHKLVLCAPAGFEQFTALDKVMYYSSLQMMNFVASDENSLRATVHNSFYLHPAQADNMINELVSLMRTYKANYYRNMIEACIRSMLEEPVLHRLHHISTQTLVLFGKNDALIPNKLMHQTTTEKLASAGVATMPHAKLTMIPDSGHFLQWEKADEVNTAIRNFLG